MQLLRAGRSCMSLASPHIEAPLTLFFFDILRIYGIRKLSSKFFDYQISRNQARLDDFHSQREETIEKLKVATKYNTTQELLEKYGAESPKASPTPKNDTGKQQSVQRQPPAPRTGLPPPPTANIRRPPSAPQTPTNPTPQPPSPPAELSQAPPQLQQSPPAPYPQNSAEQGNFAPNAYSNSGEYIESPHWYDRLLDVLLGEDETQPRNRMAMICTGCRLVNGQAPPGIKTPEELGRWRCGSCGAWNGVESETTKILSSLRQDGAPTEGSWEPVSKADADTQSSEGNDEAVMVEEQGSSDSSEEEQAEESRPEPVRRSKRGGKGKAKE